MTLDFGYTIDLSLFSFFEITFFPPEFRTNTALVMSQYLSISVTPRDNVPFIQPLYTKQIYPFVFIKLVLSRYSYQNKKIQIYLRFLR